jgi:hypothetical protein
MCGASAWLKMGKEQSPADEEKKPPRVLASKVRQTYAVRRRRAHWRIVLFGAVVAGAACRVKGQKARRGREQWSTGGAVRVGVLPDTR